jgi:hypothetical protein
MKSSTKHRGMMIHDVVSAAYRAGHRIEITFDDGRQGIVDFTPYLKRGAFSSDFETSPSFASSASTRSLAP